VAATCAAVIDAADDAVAAWLTVDAERVGTLVEAAAAAGMGDEADLAAALTGGTAPEEDVLRCGCASGDADDDVDDTPSLALLLG